MSNSERLNWITRTAVCTALLIAVQWATSPLGNSFVTGSAVNLILIVTVVICGFTSGITVAIISPVMAKLVGIGPLWSIIPFIAAGNIVLTALWYVIGSRRAGRRNYIIALVVGALAKFLTLYLGIVRIAIPFLLDLPEKQAAVISSTFSIQQLITAAIGGALATAVLPPLKNALKNRWNIAN